MKKYKSVEITETELEDLIRQAPELIEPGMQFIDHQKQTNRGPLDVLMKDSGSALVVAELKIYESDSMLLQAIDYYDYISTNLDGYARAYKKFNIDVGQDPRLLLVAPSFPQNLINRVKWINIPISLISFQCIQFEEGTKEIVPVYKEITPPGLPNRVESYSLDDRYNYITDTPMRELAIRFVEDIKTWDEIRISTDAIKYSISVKYSGKVLVYIEPRRKYFYVSCLDEEGNWSNFKFNSEDDYGPLLEIVKKQFRKLSSG